MTLRSTTVRRLIVHRIGGVTGTRGWRWREQEQKQGGKKGIAIEVRGLVWLLQEESVRVLRWENCKTLTGFENAFQRKIKV